MRRQSREPQDNGRENWDRDDNRRQQMRGAGSEYDRSDEQYRSRSMSGQDMRDDDPQQGSSGDYGRSDDGQYDGQLPGRYGQYGGQERGGYGQYGGREQSGSFNQGRGRDYSGRVSSPGHSGGYEVSRRQDPGYRDDDADRGYSSSGGGYSGGGGGTMQGGGQGSRGYGSGAGGAYGGSGYASDFAGGGQPSSGERQNHRGRGPKGYKRSDDRIREDVNDRITDDGSLDASDISVEVSDQEVTLNGTVQTRWEKRRAEDCAESVSGVGHVQNNLRVKSSSDETTASQASSSSDGTKRSR